MEKVIQFIKYSISGKLIIFNLIIFVFIHFLLQTNPNLAYYLFYNIPWLLSPWIILSNFAHKEIFHILMNLYWLYLLWPIIERISGSRIYIKLIIFSMFFNILWVQFFSSNSTLWFSWILMGFLSFMFFKYKYELWAFKEQLWFILILNILIGLIPGISLVWHISWAFWWYIYAIILNKLWK